MSLLSGIVGVATGGLSSFLTPDGKKMSKKEKAAAKAKAAGGEQTTEEQLANLNGQIAADQAALAGTAQRSKTWQYVAIGSVVLVVIGGALYFLSPKKKK